MPFVCLLTSQGHVTQLEKDWWEPLPNASVQSRFRSMDVYFFFVCQVSQPKYSERTTCVYSKKLERQPIHLNSIDVFLVFQAIRRGPKSTALVVELTLNCSSLLGSYHALVPKSTTRSMLRFLNNDPF